MEKLCFAVPAAFDAACGFGCATLSPIQNGAVCERAVYPWALDMECLTGDYETLLAGAEQAAARRGQPFVTVVVFRQRRGRERLSAAAAGRTDRPDGGRRRGV